MMPGSPVSPLAVLIYVPNLIGYARVIFLLMSLPLMPSDPWRAMAYYLTSALLDAFDGAAARALNQTSSLGAMLDMLTDRVGTCALVMGLIAIPDYTEWVWALQLFCILDIFAHWAHMHSTYQTAGGTSVSHKQIDLNQNPILFFYYQKVPLFVFCSANELFFVILFLLPHMDDKTGALYSGMSQFCWAICFPLMLVKQLFSVVHLITAFYNVAVIDAAQANAAKRAK